MQIEQTNTALKGFFKAMEAAERAGVMTYTWAGEHKMVIDHTEVSPEFEGKGIGKALVLAAVKFAREGQIKIVPVCSFAQNVFAKNADLQDILF